MSQHDESSRSTPPLRIHHILVMTVVAAVLLSVQHGLRHTDVATFADFFQSAHGVAYTIATAIASTLVLCGLWWRHQGLKFFHQPGHWLLVIESLSISTFLFAAMAAIRRWNHPYDPYYTWVFWFLGTHCVHGAIALWVAFRVADTIWWRLRFAVSAAVAWFMVGIPLLSFYRLFGYAYWLGAIVATLLLIAAASSDRRARRVRDWPHWCGVVLQLTLLVVVIAQYGWQWFHGNAG